jgi:hypothetical protein
MLNEKLIGEAVKIVVDYFAAEGIFERTESIRSRAINWYTHSEIVKPQMLAAVVISGDYKPITWDEVLEIEEFFFPTLPADLGFSIGEIEASYRDMLWRE